MSHHARKQFSSQAEHAFRRALMLVQALWFKVDRWLAPVSDWKWVGDGTVLYRREVLVDGFRFIGELTLDDKTVGAHLGTFGSKFLPGCIKVEEGRYFYPSNSEDEIYDELVDLYGDKHASQVARLSILADLKQAQGYGKDWFLYCMKLTVKRGSSVLYQTDVSGIDATLHIDRMDERVEELFQGLLPGAERHALRSIRALAPSSAQRTLNFADL